MNNTKLLLITDYYPPEIDVAANRLIDRIPILKKHFDVSILTLYTKEKINNKDILFYYGLDNINNNKLYNVVLSHIGLIGLLLYLIPQITYLKRKRFDKILVSFPSIIPLYLGLLLSNSKSQYYVEVRDLLYKNKIRKSSIYRNIIEYIVYRLALKKANKIIYLTNSIRNSDIRYISRNIMIKSVVITNGYNPIIYKQLRIIPRNELSDKIVVRYFGRFAGERNPFILFKALEIISNDLKMKLIFEFYVKFENTTLEEDIHKYINNNINKLPHIYINKQVSNNDAIKLMCQSDINLIITHTSGSEYAIPHKLFEYIGAGKPILCISNDPELKLIFKKYSIGIIVNHDVELIAKAINDILFYKRNVIDVKEYDINNIVNQLIKVIS